MINFHLSDFVKGLLCSRNSANHCYNLHSSVNFYEIGVLVKVMLAAITDKPPAINDSL